MIFTPKCTYLDNKIKINKSCEEIMKLILKWIYFRVYENNDTLRRVRHSKDRIPRESIQLIRVLGKLSDKGPSRRGLLKHIASLM